VQEILGAIFNVAGEMVALLAVLLIITRLGGWYVVLLFGATIPASSLGCARGTWCTSGRRRGLRGYPETELATTHDLFDNWRTPYS
jgi:hypothetical protein